MVEKEIHKLKKEGFQITVSDEREMLYETAGGLFKARDFLFQILSCFIMLI